jgi:LysM repeat protein
MEPQATPTRRGADPTARILAVSALAIAAIVVIVVIAGSIGGSGGSASRSGGGGHAHKTKDRYYVVQPGDTFGGIAAKENVSVARLERLNPNLDTQLLPERGCVNIVPEGCKVLENSR